MDVFSFIQGITMCFIFIIVAMFGITHVERKIEQQQIIYIKNYAYKCEVVK